MKNLSHYVKTFLVVSILTLTFTPQSYALDDAIIAVVNDDIITLRSFQEYLTSIYMQLLADGRSEEEIREMMQPLEKSGLERLIDDKLLLTEANAKGLAIQPKAIDERIADIKARYETEQIFIDALLADGLTITDLRNKITDQMKVKYIVELEVESKVVINPRAVTEYYQENKNDFRRAKRVYVDSIFIPYEADSQKAKEEAFEALQLLENGVDFAQVVKEYSNGQPLGVISKGELLPRIEEIVFALDIDEISPLVELENGTYIFKVTGKVNPSIAELVEVKDEIKGILYQEKFRTKFEKWLQKLRDKAYVEIK